jgi:hypothetical protein
VHEFSFCASAHATTKKPNAEKINAIYKHSLLKSIFPKYLFRKRKDKTGAILDDNKYATPPVIGKVLYRVKTKETTIAIEKHT